MEDTNMKSGENLFHLFLTGDTAAFEGLVAYYMDDLSGFVYSLVQDYDETEHIIIEAFAWLAASGASFPGQSTIREYLFAAGKELANQRMGSKLRRLPRD